LAAQPLAAFIESKEIAIRDALLRDDLSTARRQVKGATPGLGALTDAYRRGRQVLVPAVA
jgi:hypothetical protein